MSGGGGGACAVGMRVDACMQHHMVFAVCWALFPFRVAKVQGAWMLCSTPGALHCSATRASSLAATPQGSRSQLPPVTNWLQRYWTILMTMWVMNGLQDTVTGAHSR